MEYDEDEEVTGSIPEFGAIFMANVLTKKECFQRKIFGLPSSQAEFVKQIKAGMVLFLFEFKKRQLFGVYQASSDGAMDIVPHAFNYSGRRFPAQVRFTPIWDCDPLSERQFQDAIRENYFSAKKFKFGLSEIQVHRLLALFSSRKMKKEIIPQPMAKVVVGVAGMERRSVGDARFQLSGRGCSEPTDEYNPAAFSDYHGNSLVNEDEVFTDDRVNNEGNVYPLVQRDFLAKRRRLDTADMLLADDMPNSYNHGDLQTNHINSPRDFLDDVSSLAAVRQLLAVERARKENQVKKIRNEVLSSENVMDPRTTDEDRFMQRNRFFDEYNRDNGFTSECYEKPLDTSKHVLFDEYVHTNQNIDGNLSLHRQAMQVMEDHQCSLNRKVEKKCHFDRNGSPFSDFEHNAGLLHGIRETNSVGRFPVNDKINGEPNFGACSVENPSVTNFSRPLHYGHRIVHDMKYPNVEGRVTENILALTRNAGYFENVGGQLADNGRFSKSEGVDNEKGFNTEIGNGSSLVCPSSFSQKGSSSSFSARFLPEKGPQNFGPPRATFDDTTITRTTPYIPEHPKISHEFNVSTAANQNPTLVPENSHCGSMEDFYPYKNWSSPYILESKKSSRSPDFTSELRNKGLATNISGHQSSMRHEATSSFLNIPYIPEHAKISPEFNVSMAANQNPSLVHENPHYGSTEDFYPYMNRSSSYILESKQASRSPDIAPELHNKGFATNVSGHQNSMRHETTSSFQNSDLSMHMDRNTTVPVNDRGSLFSKTFFAQTATDRENIGEFAYHSKSSGNHFSVDENFPNESKHMSKHVPRQEMDVLAGKDFICSEAKHLGFGTYRSESDLAGFENQNIGISSKTMNCCAHHEDSKAPHVDSNVNRKSVFSRLASNEESRGGEERNGSDLDCHGRYMDASADEVMEMLRQSNNLSPRKIKKSRVAGQPNHKSRAIRQPNHGERTFGEKHVQSHTEIKLSTMEKKISKDTHLAIEESIDELPKETRIMDFKRRSYTNKNLVGSCTDSSKCNKIAGATAEVENSMKPTLKRKRLVRPVFGNTESATDVICASQNSRPLIQISENNVNQDGEKSIKICEDEMPKDNTRLNESVWPTHLSMDMNIKEHSSPEKQKNIRAHVLPSSSNELKEHKTSILGVHMDSSQALLVEILSASMDSNAKENSSPEEEKIKAHVLPSSSNELKEHKTSIVGVNIDRSQSLPKVHSPSTDCNMKEHLIPEEGKDITVHVFPSLSNEHKEHKTSIIGHIDSSQALLTDVHKPSMECNLKELSSLMEQKDIQVHVLPSSSNEPIEHKPSILGTHIDSSQGLLTEITPQKGVGIQTSVEDNLNKNVDLTADSLNPIKEKRPRVVKRIRKVLKRIKKTGIEPSQC